MTVGVDVAVVTSASEELDVAAAFAAVVAAAAAGIAIAVVDYSASTNITGPQIKETCFQSILTCLTGESIACIRSKLCALTRDTFTCDNIRD